MEVMKIIRTNKSTIQDGIVLMNEKKEKFCFNEKTDIKEIFKKIISGYNKIYSIKDKGVEKKIKKIERIDDLLACKFQGEKDLHVMKFSKLLEVSNLYSINYVGNLKLVDYNYETDQEYDIFKINRKEYRLSAIVANEKLVTIQNFSTEEKLIEQSLNNLEEIIIKAIVVQDIVSNKLKVLEVKKINIDFDFKIKIDINMEEGKKITIKLNEYSILLKKLYDLVSMTGSIFYGDL